ncbi:MAG: outer membrane beta-barrel protein, partial [Syntrophobacteraceae bacterium]|nr:outer membrane beta-barrel protein [Syntrophobacteraceae bacterium]
MITVNETYDDNIFLTKNNKVSDYITVVTPSVALGLVREHTNLQVRYAPSFYRYADRDDQNNTSHSAGLVFGQDMVQGLRFNLTDTYLQSNDPLEDPQNVQGLRQTRSEYWTNTTDANLSYIFGAENRVNVGYRYNIYENDQITLDDSKIQNPYANLTYWLDVQNGAELTYAYTDAKYTNDETLFAESDYTANAAGIRYLRRFTPNSTGYVGYNYATYDYERVLPQDFDVHDGFVGVDHSFSP